ncbi:Small nuclear RNA activating complex, polypeptide 1, 43kDa [Branchiostoma belcheri]|nr:Small nuclear RNA activating complex, polypeptide 1, 43kDa [Branchiostoma belcheri]
MSGAVGLRTDCERLLQLFTETNSVRYEQFSALWRQTNFSLIHYGRKEAREQKEFIEGAFQIVQNFLLPPYSFQVRVGALYLLYGLYYTQLNNPKVKIRMTLKMWCELLVFHQEVTEQQHLDVDFIFRTLRMDKAFLFTATPTQLIFGTKEKLPDDEDRENDQLKEQQSILPQVLGDSLEQLQDIHEKYHNMKCELGGGGRPDPSLEVVKTGIAESIAEKIHKYEEWRKTTKGRSRGRKRPVSEDESAMDEGLMESRERASRIAQIKGKSYGTFAKLPSHIRHMKQDPTTTTTSEDEEWLPTTGKKRGKAKKKRQQKTPPRCKSPTQKIREETRRLIASASQPTASSSEEVMAKKKPTLKKGKKKRLAKSKSKWKEGKGVNFKERKKMVGRDRR